MTTRTRLADVALAAGVSTATVSRVMNGKKGVAEPTRAAVLRAMDEVGYASERDGGTQGLIAVIVPELSNPAFSHFAQELSELPQAAGFNTIVCTASMGGDSEERYLEALLNVDVSGIISVSGTVSDSLSSHLPYANLVRLGIPTVFINAHDPQIEAPFFSTSDAAAVDLAVAHLRSLGHERIGLAVGQARFLPSQRKIEAFLRHGFGHDSIAQTAYTPEGGARAAARLAGTGHSAIICSSDVMALAAVKQLGELGLRVPADISVVGFDDSPLMGLVSPALTTVRQPLQTLCEAAVTTLLDAIQGRPIDKIERLFTPDLIIRNSTGPAS